MVELTRGERFKDARIVYNRNGKQTMDEVSAATGVSKSNLSSIENDKAGSIGVDSVASLAAHYGVSADWLLGLTKIPRADAALEAIEKYTGLSSTAVKRLSWEWNRDKRESLNQLLSADAFPDLLDALKAVSSRLRSVKFAYNYTGLSPGQRIRNLRLEKELLAVSVFRFAVEASNFCKSIYNLTEIEKKLDEAIEEAVDGEHTED